jgi:hypothetical protein
MDPNNHQYLRFAFELLYFASGIIVAAVGVVAIYQIMLAKDALETARSDIEMRSKREAVTLAADKCAQFGEKTIDKCSERFRAIHDAGISLTYGRLKTPSSTKRRSKIGPPPSSGNKNCALPRKETQPQKS